MSCDGNRATYFAAVSGAGSAAAQAFGSETAAKQALDDLFDLGRNGPKPPADAKLAEAQTRLLFAGMTRQKIKPPTHSASGLPKPDAQFGYALVQRTLAALEKGEPLPPQARDLFLSRERERQITNLRTDVRGRVRCGGCGQYASPIRGHTCPRTANPAALRRTLARRLGVPPSAYPDEQLTALLDAARVGDVVMRHPATGEIARVSLDGLPMALGSGFVPELWVDAGRRVVTPSGSILTVVEPAGLPEPLTAAVLAPQLVAKCNEVRGRLRMTTDPEERDRLYHYMRDLEDAIQDYAATTIAAADFGLQLTPDMPLIGASALPEPATLTSPIESVALLRGALSAMSLYIEGPEAVRERLGADAAALLQDRPELSQARAEAIAAAKLLAAYQVDAEMLAAFATESSRRAWGDQESPVDDLQWELDSCAKASGGMFRVLERLTGSRTLGADLDREQGGDLDRELAELHRPARAEEPQSWVERLAGDANDPDLLHFVEGEWSSYTRIPTPVRRYVLSLAEQLAADPTLPEYLRSRVQAVTNLDPTHSTGDEAYHAMREMMQGVVIAGGASKCPTCGQWTGPATPHDCPNPAGVLPLTAPLVVMDALGKARQTGLGDDQAAAHAFLLWHRTHPLTAAAHLDQLSDVARLEFALGLDPKRDKLLRASIAGTFPDDSIERAEILGERFAATVKTGPAPLTADEARYLNRSTGRSTWEPGDTPNPAAIMLLGDRAPDIAIPTLSAASEALPEPSTRSEVSAAASASFAYGSDPTRAYNVRYRVVDLDELIPSNLDSGAINPAYDATLQPRQRDRVASQAQIAKVAQTLTPDALLTDFKQLDKGTPIIGNEDTCVESGNGRVLALRKARETFPAQWNAYQDRLRQVAGSFGIDAAELSRMRSPVLVRERMDPVDRAAFAREANSPPVLQMSTLENARVDAKRLTDDTMLRLQVREDQSIDLALRANSNRAFVRDFMQTLPDNERATLMRADGTLNQQGIWRIKAALFTRVFPGEAGGRLAETFTEALDSTTKNFEQAVAGTLPALVRAQSRISSGQRSADLDLSADMAASLDMLARLREQDMPVGVYLEQSSLFERELTPFQETMLRHFDKIGRTPKAIRGFLNAYAQAIEDAPDPNQVDMFGGGGLRKEHLFYRIAGQPAESTPAAAAA